MEPYMWQGHFNCPLIMSNTVDCNESSTFLMMSIRTGPSGLATSLPVFMQQPRKRLWFQALSLVSNRNLFRASSTTSIMSNDMAGLLCGGRLERWIYGKQILSLPNSEYTEGVGGGFRKNLPFAYLPKKNWHPFYKTTTKRFVNPSFWPRNMYQIAWLFVLSRGKLLVL